MPEIALAFAIFMTFVTSTVAYFYLEQKVSITWLSASCSFLVVSFGLMMPEMPIGLAVFAGLLTFIILRMVEKNIAR